MKHLTPAEELALSLNKGRPVVDGIPGGSSSDSATETSGFDGDEETTSAVTETENVGRPIENMAGYLNTDEGPSTSTQNLSILPAKELYKVHLQKQIRKSDMEMDFIQLQMEEKRLNLKKVILEIELLEHQLKSGKLKDKFKAIVAAEGEGPALSIRPLCPTRWTVRSPAIRAVLSQYGMVLNALDEMAASNSGSASRAEGLRVRLQQGNVVLGLLLALDVISELEVLNASLQKNTQTVEGMLSAVSLVQESLKSKRNTEHFEAVFKEAGDMCDNLSLVTIVPPRTHRDILGRLLHTHLDQLWIFTE
ncbi:unnamed protein product [Leuciscus chuanchicus]